MTATPFQYVACSDDCAITVILNFARLPMTHSIEGQKAKHINWKFEDVVLKCQFYQWLDSMLGAAPWGLLRVNRSADANRLDDLLTFMSNAILKNARIYLQGYINARIYLGCRNLQNSMYQG